MCLHMPYSTPATVSLPVALPCPLPRTLQVSPPTPAVKSLEGWALKSDVLSFMKDTKGNFEYMFSIMCHFLSLKTGYFHGDSFWQENNDIPE